MISYSTTQNLRIENRKTGQTTILVRDKIMLFIGSTTEKLKTNGNYCTSFFSSETKILWFLCEDMNGNAKRWGERRYVKASILHYYLCWTNCAYGVTVMGASCTSYWSLFDHFNQLPLFIPINDHHSPCILSDTHIHTYARA